MVITEEQNLQTTQTDSHRRHRRMVEKMNRLLISPRLFHRPTSEWNSQSETLRSMDLVGLERDNIDMGGRSPIFQLLLESVFDSLRRSPNSVHLTHLDTLDHGTSVPFPHTRSVGKGKSEPDVQIIPITFQDKSNPPTKPQNNLTHSRLVSGRIPITDFGENPESTMSSTTISKVCDSCNSLGEDILHCGSDTTPTILDTERVDVNVKTIEYDVPNKGSGLSVDIDRFENTECNTPALGQQSLPCPSLSQSKGKDMIINSISDDAVSEGSVGAKRECRSVGHTRLVRSNKDTLVGGANKVLDEAGPDGYYKGDNPDILPGATYLSGHKTSSNEVHSYSDEEMPVNQVPNYPIYSFLKKKLMKECRQIDHIKGDGNCFFRALSKQLYGSERYHIILRNLIVDIIATNKSKFAQFVDGEDVQDHVERMSQEQSWATTCEIYAAATLLQRDIFMLTPDHLNETYSWLLFKPIFQMDTQHSNIESHPCYMTLCNTNGNHYDRVVAQHGGCNCFLPHPELGGVSYSVDLTC